MPISKPRTTVSNLERACRVSVGLVLAFNLAWTTSSAQGPVSGSVHGRVVFAFTKGMKPVQTARVQLYRLGQQRSMPPRVTDEKGQFEFPIVATGSYLLEVCYRSYCQKFLDHVVTLNQDPFVGVFHLLGMRAAYVLASNPGQERIRFLTDCEWSLCRVRLDNRQRECPQQGYKCRSSGEIVP